MPYGKDLEVQASTQHSMTMTDNPFCPRCHLRTYPRWGPHDCAADDLQKIRHTAGSILTNMHFYRVPAYHQIRALVEALAYTMALNIHPDWLKGAMTHDFLTTVRHTMLKQVGLTDKNVVARVSSKRLTVKKKKAKVPSGPARQTPKAHRQNRQAVQARKR
jgi:hypothetical protein